MSLEPDLRQESVHRARQSIVCYVTDSRSLASTSDLLPSIRHAVECGADWIQIREKYLPARELLSLTRDALAAASSVSSASANVPFTLTKEGRLFVNDRLDVALAAGAAGVHLGSESIPVADAVKWCSSGHAPPDFAIGASCHSLEDGLATERAGASYIFFGPVFDTPSKRGFGAPQGLDRLSKVCAAIKIPVIAIGGVNEENAASCINAGASGTAAIRLFQEASGQAGLRSFIANLHAL